MNPDIKRDVEAAVKILREAGAREVFIFGSAGHGTERPDSDLVDLDERNPFTEYLERKGGLVRVA